MPQFIDHSDARLMTAQPPESHPSASWVASLGVDLTPLQRYSQHILQPQPTGLYYLEFQRFIYIYIYIYISGEMVDIFESGKVKKIHEALFLLYI